MSETAALDSAPSAAPLPGERPPLKLDVAIVPLLWRLDFYDIQLPKAAAPLMKYAERLFSRPAYIDSLTASEKVMRK